MINRREVKSVRLIKGKKGPLDRDTLTYNREQNSTLYTVQLKTDEQSVGGRGREREREKQNDNDAHELTNKTASSQEQPRRRRSSDTHIQCIVFEKERNIDP